MAVEGAPPIFNYSDGFGDGSPYSARLQVLKEKFTERFGHPPSFFARAPGRVNMIGEHIDYCGYAVFPMALEQDITIAVSKNNTKMYQMSNMASDFNDFNTDVKNFEIDGKSWQHYVLCGHKGIIDDLKISNPVGMNIMVDGAVPKSAGLSSSSALVCCSGLVTMHANGTSATKYQLADICTRCERYIGTEGGGMDQSISFLAESGTAKLIEFNPLKATDVALPDGASFVIANSLREMNKSENAGEYFNLRVCECRIAAQILSKRAGYEWRKTRRLAETQGKYGKSLEEMLLVVEQEFHKEPYSREEICKALEITDQELISECLNASTKDAKLFKLYNRAKHVYSEADRVWKFKEICQSGKESALVLLGELMNASHQSCSADYECSCDELDLLTSICRSSGALGSRLTGAGWGGCTVSLVPNEMTGSFLDSVKAKYYDVDERRKERVAEALFATKPGAGAAIIQAE